MCEAESGFAMPHQWVSNGKAETKMNTLGLGHFRGRTTRVALASLLVLMLATATLIAGLGLHGGFTEMQQLTALLGDGFWTNITVLGDFRVLLALMLPFSVRYPRVFLSFLIASLLAGLAVRGLKLVFHLPRPIQLLGTDAMTIIGIPRSGKSFPSSHAALVGAFVMVWVPQLDWKKILPMLVGALLVGLARIAVGAHWPIDVLVGAMVGISAGWFAALIVNRVAAHMNAAIYQLVAVVAVLAVASLAFDSLGYPEALLLRCLILGIGVAGYFTVYILPALTRSGAGSQNKLGNRLDA